MFEFFPTQPARQAVIHRRHYGVIENVAVEVDPEAVEFGAKEVLEPVLGGALDSSPPNGGKVDHHDGGVLDTLAPSLRGLGGVSPGELDDVLIQYQRTAALQVGHDIRSSAGSQRQFHRSGLAVGLGFRLVEVGVPVDEEQPVTPAAPQRQQVAEQNRAVAA